jgi:PAS domain S-box-containing protein
VKRTPSKRLASTPQVKKLRARVQELEETFAAIQRGRVDAVVVSGEEVLVENMNEGAATLDQDGLVLYANSSFARTLGSSLEALVGTPLRKHFPAHEQDQLQALVDGGLRGESRGEVSLTVSGTQRRLLRLSMSPVREYGIRTICVVATDMTELSDANEALRLREDTLRNLSGRLLRLQDDERRRISRDLHDVTGQKLALLSMDLSSAAKQVNVPKNNEEVKRLLLESLELSNEVSKEIRTLSYLLHPPLLDELGLSSAVAWFAQGFESRTGIQVEVDIPPSFERLAPDAEVALFRVIQESLANVHRYSGSPTAYVRARSDAEEVRLEVGDFGRGMGRESKKPDRASAAPLGVGIQGMRERVRQLSGTLEIGSRAGNGTVVTAILPISKCRVEEVVGSDDSKYSDVKMAAEGRVEGAGGWRKRILIADDHDVLRRGIRTMLEADPELEVCGEAVDGKDALEKTLAQAPDLIILDINMPVMNGIDVLRQIVRHRPQTKILAFSVHDSKQMVEEILSAGAHSYVSKGTGGQHLVHEVRALLNVSVQAKPA